MKAMKFLLPAAIGIGLAAPASAQESAPSHYYLGATAGQGHWRSMCQNAPSCDDTNTTLSVFAGYRINPIFSAELAFRNYGMVHASTASIKGKGWEVDGLASWPVFEHFSVFGKLGIKRAVVKGDGTLGGAKETNYGPTYGVGVQYEINKNIALRGEWQAYPGLGGSTLPKGDLDTLSVGALWRF
jgi:OOP family OmpA-OmpF porin